MLNKLKEKQEATAPFLDTFEYEWYFDTGSELYTGLGDDEWNRPREEYLRKLIAKVVMIPKGEVDIIFDERSWSCLIKVSSYYNTFLFNWASYIARAICKVYKLDKCRYTLSNQDTEYEVFVSHVVFGDEDN